jgi:hypothetical protein
MKIRNLKTKVIGPALLLIPMACMHLGDNHHSGTHHSMIHQQSNQTLAYDNGAEDVIQRGRTELDDGFKE